VIPSAARKSDPGEENSGSAQPPIDHQDRGGGAESTMSATLNSRYFPVVSPARVSLVQVGRESSAFFQEGKNLHFRIRSLLPAWLPQSPPRTKRLKRWNVRGRHGRSHLNGLQDSRYPVNQAGEDYVPEV